MANDGFSTSPHLVDGSSPLEAIVLRALRRYGEAAPSTMEGEAILVFIDHANAVLDDLMIHPYWDKGLSIPYYEHQSERRDVPDSLMLAGVLSKMAVDMGSQKAQRYEQEYFARMNAVLLRRKFGASASYELQAVDYPNVGGVK
jgi:hypothetical protein